MSNIDIITEKNYPLRNRAFIWSEGRAFLILTLLFVATIFNGKIYFGHPIQEVTPETFFFLFPVVVLIGLWNYKTSHFSIGDKYITGRSLFFRIPDRVRLSRITNVRVLQTKIDRMLKVASLVISPESKQTGLDGFLALTTRKDFYMWGFSPEDAGELAQIIMKRAIEFKNENPSYRWETEDMEREQKLFRGAGKLFFVFLKYCFEVILFVVLLSALLVFSGLIK